MSSQVFLVPGFLGFSKLGSQGYFTDVAGPLEEAGFTVTPLDTISTGSIAARARHLADELVRTLEPGVEHLHFVGHSTGGLDVRLLLGATRQVLRDHRFADGSTVADARAASQAHTLLTALDRTRAAVGLATPHRGTPLADLALAAGLGLVSQRTVRVITHPLVRPLTGLALRSVQASVRRLAPLTVEGSFTRWISGSLLDGEPHEILLWLSEVGLDTGALLGLTTTSMTSLHPALQDRPGVRYASACTAAPRPTGGLGPPGVVWANTAVYRALWQVTGHDPAPLAPYAPGDLAALRARWTRDAAAGHDVGDVELPEPGTVATLPNDGIVPTYSQVHGEVVAVVASDHLDCVGFYPHCQGTGGDWPRCEGRPSLSGWVRSGADYRDSRHAFLWSRLAACFTAAEQGEPFPV
ncbi:MAG: hypothetical protein H6732_10140 [Alphaproteobacteria bacterium]|nr:hypothetical protein [Alphaproteobacteria bacterium]